MPPGLSRRRLLATAVRAALLAPSVTLAAPAAAPARYRDPAVPVAARVDDLLARMTLEEKVAQLLALWSRKAEVMDGLAFDPARARLACPDGVGQITRPSDKRGAPGIGEAAGGSAERWRTPRETVAFINAVQHWATRDTRLGIPVLFHEEALHGYMATGATMFPQAIALAGSFDTDLVRRVNGVIAREVRARGVPLVLSPVVDIARDPRWGRIEETFGEDPFLVGEMGVAAVQGLQGESAAGRLPGGALPPGHVFATLKHLAGHGQPQGGLNVGPAPIAERELREYFLPPFETVIARTGVAAVMPSYNEIDGLPSHASGWLLRRLLRGEWAFDGLVVSDYQGVAQLESLHHVVADGPAAARRALAAGVDCELPDGDTFRSLAAQVREGAVDEALVDAAVRRVLALKFRAGLFEQPFGDADLAEEITGNAEARALALEAARKSLCLLRNDGILPLDPGRHRRIAVIGPNADIARLGGYSSVPLRRVSLLEGLRTLLGAKVELHHAQGAYITRSEDRSADAVELADPQRNRALIAEAAAVAAGCDVIVLAIGDTEQTSREGFAAHHLGDRARLDLVGEQGDLFAALRDTGVPVVVCAINGRPPSWPSVARDCNALLECWYPGQEGGTAVAEALFGITNPAARLPLTVVRDEGQIPLFYNRKPSARRGYLFSDAAPLFPFGWGLSYTRFEYGRPALQATTVTAGDTCVLEVVVTNAGERAGDEVVQLYARDHLASVTRPVLALKGFQRISLPAGASRRVRFRLPVTALAVVDHAMRRRVEPGTFELLVGPNSVDLQGVTLTVGAGA